MPAELTELPFLSSVGLMMTYRCPIACPHCIVEAGPHRKEEVYMRHAESWIRQAAAYRDRHVKGLALTGGEPFYNLDNLIQISECGDRAGLIVSVVTSAFWADSEKAAIETLERVPAVRFLSFSTDTYHQKSIPFGNVVNAVRAAQTLGRRYNIAICTDSEDDPRYRSILADLEAIGEADNIRLSITFPVGRAQVASRHFDYQSASEPTVSACSMAGSPVIFPDGRVIACIGPVLTLPGPHPMLLGNLHHEDLAEIFDRAELNPILHAVRVWGPHKLVELLRHQGLESELPDAYLRDCVCDPCFKLLSSQRHVTALEKLFADPEYRQLVAYARLYYLNEATMAERCSIGANDRHFDSPLAKPVTLQERQPCR